MPKALIFILSLYTFFFLSTPVFASFSLSISSINPDNISYSEQEVTVNVNINDLPSESYFRIAWQESSGKPYFGYMKNNNGDWVKIESSQDCKNYYKISDLTTTSLLVVIKIGEENTINNGPYLLKARRYTASCSSYTDSDPVSIQVNLPISSPSPTPSPSPSPSTSAAVSSAPSPQVSPVKSPIKSPSPSPKAIIKPPSPSPKNSPEVLGETVQVLPSPSPLLSPSPSPSQTSASLSRTKIAVMLTGSGAILIGLSFGFFLWYNRVLRSSAAERDAGLKKILRSSASEEEGQKGENPEQ